MFTSLHAHTEYSNLRLLDGIGKVKSIINSAYAMGYKGIAITDHESLSGHVKAFQYGKELREKHGTDFKVLLGNEIYLTETRDTNQRYYHFLLIAKDDIGHRQLRELSSQAWENSYYDRRMERTVTLKSDIASVIGDNKGHLIASTACLGSEFASSVLQFVENGNKLPIHQFVTWAKSMFGDDFYIEIQPGESVEQNTYNQFAVKIAKAYGIKWIVTNDVHYIRKADRTIHAAYLNSKEGDRELEDFYSSTYMHTEDEMLEKLSYLGEDAQIAIDNTMEIWDKCENIDLSHPTIVPEIQVDEVKLLHLFKDWYEEYDYIKLFADSEYIQDRFFLYQVEQGFIEKQQEFNEENLARINIEFKELWEISVNLKQRLSAYYNLTKRMVDIMWDDSLGNSLVGIARGSVTGFYTAYLTSITQMNPIPYKLPHWRHISATRPELPKQHWAYKVNV